MAFDLRATLRLTDNFTGPSRSIMRSASNLAGGIGKLTGIFLGLSGAIGGAVGAKKLFDATIGEAAKYEQSTITIKAILNDKELGQQYMDLVNKFAIDSPIMDSQAMLANSKSFLTTIGGDMKQLKQAWSLAERMAAIDPVQGVEGAVFALREMFSGDSISMVRRFEMPKKIMNDIKKMDIPDQLVALDKYFNKIGMTQKLIDEMAGTTLGIWAQIKEKVAVIFRDMGAPALQVLKKFIDGLNDGISGGKLDGFKKTGAKMLENIAQGFVNAATGIGKWIDSIRNNEEFKRQTTLFGQVKWVIDDVYAKFLEWLDNGGRDKITKVVSDLVQILIAAVESSMEVIAPVAKSVGSAIAAGIQEGFAEAMKSSWVAQILSGDQVEFAKARLQKIGLNTAIEWIKKKKSVSHASGLSYVPRNGYQATLHKGERVLTPEENKAYNEGKGGNSYAFHVTLSGSGSTEKDAERLFEYFVRKVEAAGGAGA
jgi:hypothetical protein